MSKNISVIVLTYNEEKHLERLLRSLVQIAADVYIIDSFSTDTTLAIAEAYNCRIFQRKWINYADQFQWALDNCNLQTPWVMRMDADEYLEPKLIEEINRSITKIPETTTGIYIRRKVIFKKKWIRYGGFYPHTLMRIWRIGVGNIEQRWMDEHIVLSGGKTTILKEHIVDENLNSINWWVNKHNSYAIREMIDLLNIKYHFLDTDLRLTQNESSQAKRKRILKEKVYSNISPGLRATYYFLYRYIVRFGFLDGYKGFIFHFMQGYWYRLLVDVNVMEFEDKLQHPNRDNITMLLEREYNFKFKC